MISLAGVTKNPISLKKIKGIFTNEDDEITYPSFNGKVNGRGNRILVVSQPMKEVINLVQCFASGSEPILITGETGAGKDLIAGLIHYLSDRKGGLHFINCGSMPDDLIYSELFGHRRGTFTSATENREGIFQQVNGGTIVLNEIHAASRRFQCSLLDIFDSGQIRPLGSSRSIKVNVRIIAVTNRDLEKLSQQGQFGYDLFCRLSRFWINVPPLRERLDDIEPLVKKILRDLNVPVDQFDSAVLKDLCGYDWPGNVRELENVIIRAVNLSGSQIDRSSSFLRYEPSNGRIVKPSNGRMKNISSMVRGLGAGNQLVREDSAEDSKDSEISPVVREDSAEDSKDSEISPEINLKIFKRTSFNLIDFFNNFTESEKDLFRLFIRSSQLLKVKRLRQIQVLAALFVARGKKSMVADNLGVSRPTLDRYIAGTLAD